MGEVGGHLPGTLGGLSHPPTTVVGPQMSWSVVDFTADEASDFAATGGHFQSLEGHRYLVTVRVHDHRGVQRITLEGSGNFQSATKPTASGVSFQAPQPLPASVPHHEFNNSGDAPTDQG